MRKARWNFYDMKTMLKIIRMIREVENESMVG